MWLTKTKSASTVPFSDLVIKTKTRLKSEYLKLSEQASIATMSHENSYVSVQERLASLSQGSVTKAAIAILAGIGLIVYGISILAGKR